MSRILLVDDEPLQLKLNKAILESAGYEVMAALDAQLALDDARALRPDLIVSDVLMGDVDGFGLCRRVKADEGLASIPVLLLSAHYGGEHNAQLAKQVGARALVERTAGFERELEAVRTCLSSEEQGQYGRGSSMYEEHLQSNANQLKKLATQAATAERRMTMMFAAANVGISVLSAEGILLEANPYWTHLTSYEPDEIIGKSVAELLASDQQDTIARYRESVKLGRTRVVEVIRHRAGHLVWVEMSTQMVMFDGVPQMFVVAQDVSERVEAQRQAAESEASRKKLEDNLAQAQKLDALGRLTGGIAHDFNNLLAVIMTHAHFLCEDLGASDPRLADVNEIAAAADRAAALTKQLLAFSRHQRLALTAVDVGKVCNDLARMLQRLIGEDIELRMRVDEVGVVKADVSQLEQVIVNLVVNARDAMPTGGSLSVETSRMVVGEGQEIGAGEWLVLAVRDTGMGMEADTKRRLFEPFFTTKERGRGTGLGLSTSYGIVKQFGGHILVDSEVGQGTVMRVLLPAVGDELSEVPAARSSTGQRGCETVLLVEDDRAVRAALTRVLVERGYEVLAAGSLDEAMTRVHEHSRAVELIVCDVVMPGSSGPDAIAKLVEQAPRARVLLMSGYTDHVAVDTAMRESQGFIQKPFAPDVFSQKVREILGREVG